MDRFIDRFPNVNLLYHIDLKSNMDRFIGGTILSNFCAQCYLKSNMDRFIANTKRNIKKFVKI